MALAISTIFHHDKRRHSRVSFERSVKLYAHDATIRGFHVKNLSLGGMYLEGKGDLATGQNCHIELHETGRRSSMIYRISGKVVHAESNGLGIEFTGMEEHSLMYVQTMLLYSSDDPFATAEQFDESFVPSTASSC
ncbi:MAG: PilZ domain-containing protein [Desulfobulbus sp.]|nr:PilZ domain-containing protein [Desulfobulbus sp.]